MAVSVQDLLDKIHFHVIYSTETALQKEITTSEIMRPGLEMADYFDYFTPELNSAFWDERVVLHDDCSRR